MGPLIDHGIPLREEDLDSDPVRQFASWFGEAGAAGVREPQAAALATASAGGVPSVRMVLVNLDESVGIRRNAGELPPPEGRERKDPVDFQPLARGLQHDDGTVAGLDLRSVGR